jgi:hypothetical protein
MLNPQMKSWGFFEATRQKAAELQAQREARGETAQTSQPQLALGSMEWLAAQNKSA